jgi:MGT family glycosyltransferase
MARIVFFGFPGHGHVNPTLPVVSELARRGHNVVYYNTPEFRPSIERAGVTFRPYPDPNPGAAELATVAQNPVRVTRLILAESKRMLPFLLSELEREQPDAVVFDSIALWGMQAAHLLRLPALSSITTFVQEDVKGLIHWRDGFYTLRQALPVVPDLLRHKRALIARYGADVFPCKDIFPAVGKANIVYTSRLFQPPTPFINETFHFVGPSINPQTRLADDFPWGQIAQMEPGADRPLIYVSLGTIYHLKHTFYQMLFETFHDYPGRFVLSAGSMTDPVTLGSIPNNFLVRHSVPQLQLLQHVDLFITHGGMNSINEGLYYGVPLLVIPQQIEQLLNARQVAAHGAGLILGERPPYGRATGKDVRQAVGQLLSSDNFRQNAGRLQDSLHAAGGFGAAADVIESVVT